MSLTGFPRLVSLYPFIDILAAGAPKPLNGIFNLSKSSSSIEPSIILADVTALLEILTTPAAFMVASPLIVTEVPVPFPIVPPSVIPYPASVVGFPFKSLKLPVVATVESAEEFTLAPSSELILNDDHVLAFEMEESSILTPEPLVPNCELILNDDHVLELEIFESSILTPFPLAVEYKA